MRNKKDVIMQFCILSSCVRSSVFKDVEPADCFCDDEERPDFVFSQKVFNFIEDAVLTAVKKGGRDGVLNLPDESSRL